MCGIFGSLLADNNPSKYNTKKILQTMSHRGPDQNGSWHNEKKSILLINTRLSILDLSTNGCQPMVSSSGRFVIVYNGEIYNNKILRKEISEKKPNLSWKSTTDTETLLELIEIFGVEKSLNKIDGMFAFGIWDSKYNELTLARDKIGQKPLYYGWADKDFIFASELKTMKVHPKFSKEISIKALNYYFAFNYIKAPYSIYKNFFKLPPGSILKIKENNIYEPYHPDKKINDYAFSINKWWSVYDTYKVKKKEIFSSSLHSNAQTLEKILSDSIVSQMISDVSVGCFLSGGIDSSLVAALMQINSRNKIKTFTIGFEKSLLDESVFANNISSHIGTDHTELILKSSQASILLENMHEVYDEPFGDSCQIPTYLLSKLARTKVSVALSGIGADELFGGYNRHFWVPIIWKKISVLPFFVRKILGNLLLSTPEFFFDCIFKYFNFEKSIDIKIKKLAYRLKQAQSLESFYFSLLTEPNLAENLVLEKININLKFDEELNLLNLNFPEKMMAEDKNSYLPDDLMCTLDRAAMSNSLETRAPFLSADILNFSAQLPLEHKIIGNKGKIILREILQKYVPINLFERPKFGFGIPIDNWLRNDTKIKELVFTTLDEVKIKNQGLLNGKMIKTILHEHYSNKRNYGNRIWSLLIFQNWLENQ